MNRFLRVLLVAAIFASIVAPVAAQEEENIIIASSYGNSLVNTLNPVTLSTSTEFALVSLLFPGLLGTNPETAIIEPGVPGALAESWEFSEDGTVLTINLKDNFMWSDGTPVTAEDFVVVWEAITSGQVDSIFAGMPEYVADIEAADDYTLTVTLHEANCEALLNLPTWAFPSHLIETEEGVYDWAALNELTFTEPGAITAGPYQVSALENDRQVVLQPVPDVYPDTEGEILNEGYAIRLATDQVVEHERFLAGDFDYMEYVQPDRRAEFEAIEGINTYEFAPGDFYDHIALNLANPENPQPGLDEEGNIIEQDPHPIFGDVRVRQALAHGVDQDAIIEAALFGEGVKMNLPWLPGTWVQGAMEDIPFYEYDPELAAQMLEEAGWVDQDGDGVRECVGCLYAEEGDPLEFDLITIQGNTRRTAIGQLVQDMLSDIGVRVNFQGMDFNAMVELMDAQTFDAAIAAWGVGYPYSPDQTQLFSIASDLPGGGSNYSSWHSPEFDELMRQALTVPGCDPEERAALYAEAARIWFEDPPYIVMHNPLGFYTWHDRVENVEPYPNNLLWNVTEWVKPAAAAAE